MSAARPIAKAPPRLRQRRRADGSWRLWWEPEPGATALGFEAVELDAGRLTWSRREAERLNALVTRAREAGATAGETAARRRTVDDLMRAFALSPRFAQLRPATQRDYRATFRRLGRKWGASPVAFFTKPVMVEWYETLHAASGPAMAAHELRVMSVLMTYAERRGWIGQNPCLRIGMSTPQPRDRVADWDDFDQLVASARALGLHGMALAIGVAFLQGQRQEDVRAARLEDFADGRWLFVRSKRGNAGGMDVHPELAPMIEARRAAGIDAPELVICERTGRPYAADLFRRDWARVRAHAAARRPGVDGLQFRDLRRSFAHGSRLGGASGRDVGDALGNRAATDPRLSRTYMPDTADTASRAVAAHRRPDPTTSRKKDASR